MKNRERNNHFAQRNALYLYCLRGDLVVTLLDTTVLTSVFRPPPANVTVNITTHYDKTTLNATEVPLLYPHVHIGSLWVFLIMFSLCYTLYSVGYNKSIRIESV